MSSSISNEDFARRMRQRRSRARFPDLPADVIACMPCTGAGVHAGEHCKPCNGFGFVRPDGTPAEVHSARGGFYEFGAVDAVFETMCNIKMAYAGPSEPSDSGWYPGKDGREYYFLAGFELLDKLAVAKSQRFAYGPAGERGWE